MNTRSQNGLNIYFLYLRSLSFIVIVAVILFILINCGETKITYCEISYIGSDFSSDGKKIAFFMQTDTYVQINASVGNQIESEERYLQVYVYDLETGDSEMVYDMGQQLIYHELKWNPKSYITIHHISNADYITKIYLETKNIETIYLTNHAQYFCLPKDTDVIIYNSNSYDTLYIENMDKFSTWIKEINTPDGNHYSLIYLDSEKLLGVESRNGTIYTIKFNNDFDSYNLKRYYSTYSYKLIDWIDSTHFISGNKPYLYELKDTYIVEKKLIADIYYYKLSNDKKQLIGFTENRNDDGTKLNHNMVLLEDINDPSSLKIILKDQKIELDRYEYESIF